MPPIAPLGLVLVRTALEDHYEKVVRSTPILRFAQLPTIDELYLGSETSVAMLRAQLRTNNLSHQSLALAAVDIDPDPSVRAQALYSLARIGEDPDGAVTRSIGKMMLREHVGRPDPGVMYAALVAIESIHQNTDNQIHGAATEMLLQVAVGEPYTRLLRSKAMQVLAKM